MNDIALSFKQIKVDNRAFWRNPTAAIFTVFFPLIFLIVASFFNNKDVEFNGKTVTYAELVVPGIIAYGVFSACYTNLAIRVCMLRDMGVLKRMRGTPIPKAIYLVGMIGSCIVVAIVLTLLLATGGWMLYGVPFPWHSMLAILTTILLGAATFCVMALAVSGIIPNGDAAPALVNLIGFPQFLLGNIFFSITDKEGPVWVLARSLPLVHVSNALQTAYSSDSGLGFNWNDLMIVTIWLVVLSLLALKVFRWENKKAT